MSTKSQVELQTHDQIDKRVPPEIWQRIFSRLYPSQLSRLSLVNKNFYKIVSSLSVWSRMFSVTFGPKVRLRTLRNMPESKSYMLYMCASSLYICEACLGRTPFQDVSYPYRPLPVLAPMQTMSRGSIKYLGEEINLCWKIRMCTACRSSQVLEHEIGRDDKTLSRIRWYRQQH
ncbi:hypothetical protein F5H01DRAFT_361967 [Linnemannia elongata]|nr:hypothetical protein F5H01DRAFT_361967 [Linnemannia elongata]